MKRPVLFIAFYYLPDVTAGVIRPAHFTKYLLRMGYKVKVLTGAPPMPPGLPPAPGEVINVPSVTRTLDRRRPIRLFERLLRRTIFPHDEAFVWNFAAVRAAEKVVRENPDLCIISTFPTANVHVTALRLKRRYPHLRWIADFRDPMAHAPARAVTNDKDPFGKYATWTDLALQRQIMKHADVLIANTEAVYNRWREFYPEVTGKMHCIMNGFDPETTTVPPAIAPRDYKVITHTGAIYRGRGPGRLLESVGRLADNGRLNPAQLRINLVGLLEPGNFPDPALAERLVKLGCLQYTGQSVPWDEAQRQLEESDYQLLIDLTHGSGAEQLPSKIFQYIQIGRPILAYTMPESPTHHVLRNTETASVVIHPDTPDEIADERLLEFLALPNAPRTPGTWFEETFDARRRTERLAKLIDGADA